MTLSALKEMLARRVAHLSALKTSAESLGDLSRVNALEAEISETQNTLDLLNTLPS